MKKQYLLYTDGGCAHNPGGPGAFAAILINRETLDQTVLTQAYISTTNNRMEMMAVIVGLENIEVGSDVEIYSDSQYVVKTIQGLYAKKKNLDLWKRLDLAEKDKNISIHWIPGHKGDQYNEKCDSLCTQSMIDGTAIVDEGYSSRKSQNSTVKSSSKKTNHHSSSLPVGGAMAVKIDIPENIGKEPVKSYFTIKEMMEDRQINEKCAQSIRSFIFAEQRNFKAYAEIKTGKTDQWSKKKKDFFISDLGQETWDTIEKYLPEEKDALTACRWNERGLSLPDAIRKVLVDKEIGQNFKEYRS